jgi:hypothetical protein
MVLEKSVMYTLYVLDLFWAVTNTPNGCDPKPAWRKEGDSHEPRA